jgi:hypothetical protein
MPSAGVSKIAAKTPHDGDGHGMVQLLSCSQKNTAYSPYGGDKPIDGRGSCSPSCRSVVP